MTNTDYPTSFWDEQNIPDNESMMFIKWNSKNLTSEHQNEHHEKASTYAEEGTENITQIDSLQMSDSDTRDQLEKVVRREIDCRGFDFVLDSCLKGREASKKKRRLPIRFKHTKTNAQVNRLQEQLKNHPLKWPKRMRVKLGKEIGLSQIQVYKWFYDNASIKNSQSDVAGDSDLEESKVNPFHLARFEESAKRIE